MTRLWFVLTIATILASAAPAAAQQQPAPAPTDQGGTPRQSPSQPPSADEPWPRGAATGASAGGHRPSGEARLTSHCTILPSKGTSMPSQSFSSSTV
jgi:hypothetical protein